MVRRRGIGPDGQGRQRRPVRPTGKGPVTGKGDWRGTGSATYRTSHEAAGHSLDRPVEHSSGTFSKQADEALTGRTGWSSL